MSILNKLDESLDSHDVEYIKRLERVLVALDENVDVIEDSHYAIEFDQDKILEDLLAEEVIIEYKGDTVTVDDIFSIH